MHWRATFFKDLISSDGHPSSRLQQSIEISQAENIDSAAEAAKRRYEQLCGVPLYYPTRDEFAMIRVPGRSENA